MNTLFFFFHNDIRFHIHICIYYFKLNMHTFSWVHIFQYTLTKQSVFHFKSLFNNKIMVVNEIYIFKWLVEPWLHSCEYRQRWSGCPLPFMCLWDQLHCYLTSYRGQLFWQLSLKSVSWLEPFSFGYRREHVKKLCLFREV